MTIVVIGGGGFLGAKVVRARPPAFGNLAE